MAQSKKHSFLEVSANTLVGFVMSLAITYYILPLWGFAPNIQQASEITVVFTLISLIRGYIVRRLFNT